MGDPFLDDTLPREYVLYLRPTGPLAQKLSEFWQQSKQICGKNKAHNIFPHITLCQFFMVNQSSSFRCLYACIHEQPLPAPDWRPYMLHSGAAEGAVLGSSWRGGYYQNRLMPGLVEEVNWFLSGLF